MKQCFFLLFLFSIGFRTGPQFFRGLQERRPAAGGAVGDRRHDRAGRRLHRQPRVLGYDAGTAAGVIAGALTESATIGTASDAIKRLGLPAGRKRGADQPHPRGLCRHLSHRRRRRRLVPGPARPAADGHRPRGRVPALRTARCRADATADAAARHDVEYRAYPVRARLTARRQADVGELEQQVQRRAPLRRTHSARRSASSIRTAVRRCWADDVMAITGRRGRLVERIDEHALCIARGRRSGLARRSRPSPWTSSLPSAASTGGRWPTSRPKNSRGASTCGAVVRAGTPVPIFPVDDAAPRRRRDSWSGRHGESLRRAP